MKKFVLGLTCGIVLSATTAVFASDTIQAYLFPAKFIFNGDAKELNGADTLNYEGHTYVPVRFVAESMGANVSYQANGKAISIDNRPNSKVIIENDYQAIEIAIGDYVKAHPEVNKENVRIARAIYDYKALTWKVEYNVVNNEFHFGDNPITKGTVVIDAHTGEITDRVNE